MTARERDSDDVCHVAGMAVIRSDVSDIAGRILADASTKTPRVYISINANSASLRRDFPGYAEAISDPRAICVADGVSVTLGGALLGQRKIGRVPGVDVLEEASRMATDTDVSFFLLGGDPQVAQMLRMRLEERFEGLRVVGVATPPYGEWSEEESQHLIEGVRRSGADVLWLGVAAGKQEVWAMRHLDEIGVPVACVGAAFDFLSGRKRRAPRWMRRAGLEWLHRFASEPTRLWRRYTIGNATFLADLLRYGRRPAR